MQWSQTWSVVASVATGWDEIRGADVTLPSVVRIARLGLEHVWPVSVGGTHIGADEVKVVNDQLQNWKLEMSSQPANQKRNNFIRSNPFAVLAFRIEPSRETYITPPLMASSPSSLWLCPFYCNFNKKYQLSVMHDNMNNEICKHYLYKQ